MTTTLSNELVRIETPRFVEGENLVRYIAPPVFEVDGIVYERPTWYPGGMLKLYNDDKNDLGEFYIDNPDIAGEIIIIEPGDEYDPNKKKN